MFCVIRMKKINKILMGKQIMKNHQSGRSMIEMLGVLAIIGVLSVGGLAGYAKMMAQYRINTTMQQIQIMASKLSSLVSNGGSFQGLSAYTAYRLGALPTDVVESVDDSNKKATLSNVYAGKVLIEPASITDGECSSTTCDYQAYTITYTGLHEEACLALGGSPWNSLRNTSFLGFGVGNESSTSSEDSTGGKVFGGRIKAGLFQNCTGGTGNGYAIACTGSSSTVSIPMDLDLVSNACICGEGNCVLVLKFF